jgi:hypothetical protein
MLKKEKIEGRMEVTERRGKHKQLLERILVIERTSTRWHSVENSLWKRLWICLETTTN